MQPSCGPGPVPEAPGVTGTAAISSGTPSSSRNWADARIRRIYAGTNEIKKYIIGRSL